MFLFLTRSFNFSSISSRDNPLVSNTSKAVNAVAMAATAANCANNNDSPKEARSTSNNKATNKLQAKLAKVPIDTAAPRTRKGNISANINHVSGPKPI